MEVDQDNSSVKLISQGAEGRIYVSELFGQKCLVKERFPKRYRVPILDEKLTKQRLMQEAKSMDRVRRLGVATPGLYLVDQKERKLYVEYLSDAMTVKQFLNGLDSFDHPGKNPLQLVRKSFSVRRAGGDDSDEHRSDARR